MKRVATLAMGIMMMWLAVSCKKDTGNPPPPPNNDVVETKPHVLRPVTVDIHRECKGYYEALPSMYAKSDKKYPLMIYFHGAGQIGKGGSDLEVLLNAGAPKVLAEKRFPPNFVVNGQNFTFIILMPQFTNPPTMEAVKAFVDYAKSHYRYEPGRVYLAGSSLGGRVLSEFAADFPTEETAIVPMAGALFDNLDKKARAIANNRIAVWAFHNVPDESISVSESVNFVNAINKYFPAIRAKLTLFPTSDSYLKHDCWTTATDPAYKEDGKNIYEWMLQYKK